MHESGEAARNNDMHMLNKQAFAVRQPDMIGESLFKKYAVLVPLIETREGPALLFERRSDKLRRQPGEICFPGGKLEKGETPQECAIRETVEELCVEPGRIEVFGPGDTFISPFNVIIYPYIGLIRDYCGTFNPDEVSEVITVPMDYFRDSQPENYKSTIVSRLPGDFPYERIPGGENYPWANGSHDILFYQRGHHLIWGITALIVRSAAALIDQYHLT